MPHKLYHDDPNGPDYIDNPAHNPGHTHDGFSVTNRVVAVTQSATPAINTDQTDIASITGLAQAITSITMAGTPVDGQSLLIRITDNGTARAITWGSSFEGASLPTTTVISAMLVVGLIWNTVTSKWRCVGASAS